MDVASGGVLVVPSGYKYTCYPASGACNQCSGSNAQCNVVINADKQSNIYVASQSNLGGLSNGGGNNNIEVVQTPYPAPMDYTNPNGSYQGYWASPAYWYDGSNDWVFYSATDQIPKDAPYPIGGYQLTLNNTNKGQTNPVPQTATASTAVGFCPMSPTPSVSSDLVNPATGVLWAIENPDKNSGEGNCNGYTNQHAVLHAFCATVSTQTSNVCYSAASPPQLNQLYISTSDVVATDISKPVPYSVPTVFNGLVFMGTGVYESNGQAEVDVFGPCSVYGGCIKQP